MTLIDKTINELTDFDKEIDKLKVQRKKLNDSISDIIKQNSDLGITKHNLIKSINIIRINELNLKDICNKIDEVNKDIEELIKFKVSNKDWEGGKYPGDVSDTPDGCRIRFDGQSRSFKFQNYKITETTIVCKNKEDCYLQAKKYLYDYFNSKNKISNQYKYFHPKYIEVKLPNGLTFITNSKFIDLIEKNNIISKHDKKYDINYVMYLSGNKEHSPFYKLVTKYSRVKYLNGNTLDLREENLEESDNSVLAKRGNGEIEIEIGLDNKEIKPKTNKDGYLYDTWILGKYAGTVFERTGRSNWSVVVKKEDGTVVTKTLTFNEKNKDELYKKAVQIKNELSDQHGLTKNKIRIINDNVIEVELTQNQIMKTDYKFLDTIQKYNLYSTKSSDENSKYYASIDIDGKMHKFHKYITGFEMVDHIDRNPLNNCLSNLRKADHKLNNNNRSISGNSKAVCLGVTYCERDNCFRARIKQDNIEHSIQFSVSVYGFEKAKQMAINARQEYNRVFSCANG